MDRTDEEIVDAWITYHGLPDEETDEYHPLFWAWETVDDLVRDNPERAWRLIPCMCDRAPTELMLATIAAGPMEDLLVHHGQKFIDRIEQTSAANPGFKKMLGAVWKNTIPDDVWNRLKAVAGPSF